MGYRTWPLLCVDVQRLEFIAELKTLELGRSSQEYSEFCIWKAKTGSVVDHQSASVVPGIAEELTQGVNIGRVAAWKRFWKLEGSPQMTILAAGQRSSPRLADA